MIRLDHASKRYGGFEALKDVTLSVDPGEFVFVTGHSGAGKTTLLKLIAAIERPSAGGVVVNGQNIASLRAAAVPYLRRQFGLVFQDHKLLFDRNVFDNVMLPLAIAGFPYKEAAKRVRAALDKVALLNKEKTLPVSLSGGEQQRLCIARAVVSRPAILLADEPTGNLDAAYAAEIFAIFQAFHEVGVTAIIATHDPSSSVISGARVIELKHGALASDTRQAT